MNNEPASKSDYDNALEAFKSLNMESAPGSQLVKALSSQSNISEDRARYILRNALDKGIFKTDKFLRLYPPQDQS